MVVVVVVVTPLTLCVMVRVGANAVPPNPFSTMDGVRGRESEGVTV